ncbi:MAG: flagellar export chaperone FliS [Planctomycetota bacterium]|jgi:flagellar protein FliS
MLKISICILTASKEQLVLMLYDGAIRFCEAAKKAWNDGNDLENAHKSLIKAQDIILELTYSLNKEEGGDLADKMSQLYAYCYSTLVTANLERSEKLVTDVQNVITDLREGWAAAMEQVVVEDTENQAALSSNQTSEPIDSQEKVELSTQAPTSQPEQPKGKVLAKIPIVKVPADQAIQADSQPRLSVQG